MLTSNIKTPGVYIDEINAFPNSVVPVATAVPAFIGYTPQAHYQGKSYYNKAQKITSFAEFQAIYMLPEPPAPADPAVQYHPEYYLVEQKAKPASGNFLQINGSWYAIAPDPGSVYHLYNSIRLFYQNGGGDAYIVAVGGYGKPSGKAQPDIGKPIVNPNVKLSELQAGLALLKNQQEPTLYLCPEATLLDDKDNATLMQAMLAQASEMKTALCLFDVTGGHSPDPVTFSNDIDSFRKATGSEGLDFGAAYYPFVGTTIMQSSEINYTNLFGGDLAPLKALLSPPEAPDQAVDSIIAMIEKPPADPMTVSQYHSALLNASNSYSEIIKYVLSDANILPPSGGMAGVYTVNDNTQGVWHAPANTSMVGAASLPLNLSDEQQQMLNEDAVSGKSINAIRFFPGQGILIWGARTLDGNSQDWRYVPVRRTVNFLEQSLQLGARAYVFEPNVSNTWNAVKSELNSFLLSVWKQGGLQGATAADAFLVEVGLGSTMTADDIQNGIMKVSVKVALVRPAEFIVIEFNQQMAKSG